ncbi:MAG TPA: RusA family crossover junction endodeoxyribonuclease [Phycisphaerae bacterium]|nr:RusA family crossover junction endodeoxyribonuclease [Phycisphaerae bacterium]
MRTIELPFPPSANHYYRRVGHRTLISREGRGFRTNVCALLGGGGPRKPPMGGRIALTMDAFPPDRRRRDLDNIQKSTFDALQHAGVYEDDSLIDAIVAIRHEPVSGGRLVVRVEEFPLSHCPFCRRAMPTIEETKACNWN